MTVVRSQDAQRAAIAARRTRYLAHTDDLMVTVIDFDDGPAAEPDPPHSHPHQQVTYVAAGEVLFFIDGTPHKLGPGDLITIPSNVPHTVQTLSAHVRLVDSFMPIRTDFLEPEA